MVLECKLSPPPVFGDRAVPSFSSAPIFLFEILHAHTAVSRRKIPCPRHNSAQVRIPTKASCKPSEYKMLPTNPPGGAGVPAPAAAAPALREDMVQNAVTMWTSDQVSS